MHERKRGQIAWAFYDWANSAFAVVVMAGFFPLFFKRYWAGDLAVTDSTYWLGVINSGASLMIVLLAPLLGAIADQLERRKAFLLILALVGIVTTACLSLVARGEWQIAVLLYLFAVVGFSGANVFYDALLLAVSGSRDHEADRVSALGFSLGYLGGGLLFAICVLMHQQPHWFGLADGAAAVKWSFLLVSVWWSLFSLPLVFYLREPRTGSSRIAGAIRAAGARIWRTLREIGVLRQAVIFLLAYWLYIDGVHTIIRMAVDYGLSLGFDDGKLITALLLTQFIGFPATFLFGRLARYIGVRSGIVCGLSVYILVTVWGSLMQEPWEFYLLAAVVGLVQGGVQALSRSLYARLIPPAQAAELFGFYNMIGKSASVLGPVMMGWIGVLTGNPRIGILSLLILFFAGFGLLLLVKIPPSGKTAAA